MKRASLSADPRESLASVSRLTAVQTPGPSAGPDGGAGGPALLLDGVSKAFRIPHRNYSTLKERLLHPGRSNSFDEMSAVDDITLEIARGEFFGIVGRNGSGKSTLLKCLAGIYQVDSGRIEIDGRLSPFIELGVGFNPELSARENVMINAIMLGLTRRQARERFDQIIAFAELEEFVDLKLKNYSSGMSVRLGFSVAIEVDADILLVDEVLAVGDAAFQQKCNEQFQRLKDEGRTIVFVTHDMAAVERFCDRAMLLERGAVVDIGAPEDIAREYNQVNFGRLPQTHEEGERHGDRRAAEITAAWFENVAWENSVALAQGEFCHVCVEVRFHEDVTDPVFGWTLRNEARHAIFVTTSFYEQPHTGSFAAGETVIVRTGFVMRLASSRYTLSPYVARAARAEAVIDIREDLASLLVHSTRHTGGVVDLEQNFEVIRR
jgi:ABC-type polysaccharide/polyol phosphate transport system ATPase subunit